MDMMGTVHHSSRIDYILWVIYLKRSETRGNEIRDCLILIITRKKREVTKF